MDDQNIVVRKAKTVLRRCKRWLIQTVQPASKTIPVFVTGSARSGTSMVMTVFDQSPYADIFQQMNPKAFDKHSLRDMDTIRNLISKSKAKVAVFKPLHDNQYSQLYLNKLPELKIIWLSRNYADCVNSSARKWGNMKKRIRVISEDPQNSGWWGDQISKENLKLVQSFYNPEMREESAYALMWYIRHSFFFELSLGETRNVRIFQYEDMVRDPEKYFMDIFKFCGCPFHKKYTHFVHSNSINKNRRPAIDPKIEELCRDLTQKLETQIIKSTTGYVE